MATGIMGSMRIKTFMPIFRTSEVAFHENCFVVKAFTFPKLFVTNLRPGGIDFRNAFVIKISKMDTVRNNKLKLMTIPE